MAATLFDVRCASLKNLVLAAGFWGEADLEALVNYLTVACTEDVVTHVRRDLEAMGVVCRSTSERLCQLLAVAVRRSAVSWDGCRRCDSLRCLGEECVCPPAVDHYEGLVACDGCGDVLPESDCGSGGLCNECKRCDAAEAAARTPPGWSCGV